MSLFEAQKTYKPFKYEWAVAQTRVHDNIAWTEDELRLQGDVLQWNSGDINSQERAFITEVLKMFTQSDVAVGETYKNHLIPVIKNNEVSNMLTSFAAREAIHQRAYALLNETLGLDDSVWSEFLGTKEYKCKIDNLKGKEPELAHQVAKLALSEGVSLFASFIMLLEFGTRGKMLGMCEAVEWSIRDETQHVLGNTQLFKEIVNCDLVDALPYHNMVDELIHYEDCFIDKAFTLHTPDGYTCEDMKQYMRFLADRRLAQMGLVRRYNVTLPPALSWVDAIISGTSDKNFFEGVVTDYTQEGMKGEVAWDKLL